VPGDDEYRERTIQFLVEMEMAIAQHNNGVIAGRGSFALLHDYRDALNVRVKAPFDTRVRRIAEDEGLSGEEARKYVAQRDRVRKHFVESDIHFSYTDTTMFDIMLDTSVVPLESCIDLLVDAVESGVERREDDRPSVTTIKVEPVLKEHVNKMLEIFRENPDYALGQEQ
jgi:cytidylate kinase